MALADRYSLNTYLFYIPNISMPKGEMVGGGEGQGAKGGNGGRGRGARGK